MVDVQVQGPVVTARTGSRHDMLTCFRPSPRIYPHVRVDLRHSRLLSRIPKMPLPSEPHPNNLTLPDVPSYKPPSMLRPPLDLRNSVVRPVTPGEERGPSLCIPVFLQILLLIMTNSFGRFEVADPSRR